MTAAWVALFVAGSEESSAAERRRATKTLRLCRMIGLLIAMGALILGGNRSMAGDDSRGAQLAAICASCHRLDGRDKGMPSIVGVDQKQFVDLMAAFKSGERPSQIMHAITLSLNDQEIAALAAYLAAQPAGINRR
jgi:cytochrome subunit of sulfide dehydrogenase